MPQKRKRGISVDNIRKRKVSASRNRRRNLEVRTSEQERDTIARRARRSDPQVRVTEQASDTIARRTRRSDPQVRVAEQASDTIARRTRRSDPQVRVVEQASDTIARRARRSDPQVRAVEKERDTMSHQLKRREAQLWKDTVIEYNKNVMEGPTWICYSCDRLFFKHSIKFILRDKLIAMNCSENFLQDVIIAQYLDDDTYQLCSTCATYIYGKNKKYPRLNVNMSNLAFPNISDLVRNLAPVEERLVAPRIPFTKIFGLGCDRQFGLRAGVINVPVNIPKMFKTIPIKPDQAEVLHLKLKRKLSYKSHFIYERIRPQIVYKAGEELVKTELYIKEEVTLDQSWPDLNITEFNADIEENTENDSFISNVVQETELHGETETLEFNEEENAVETGDISNEEQLYEETLLDSNTVIEFAPGEGERPMPLLLDTYCEELSFPTILGGHARTCSSNVKLSYEDHILSEIMRSDRRAVRPDHLLFVHKKSQLKQLCSNVNIALKKTAQSRNITVSQALDQNQIKDFISKDSAYRFLTNITGSPAYWEQQKKNLLGMVRQLGGFTIFLTLTAAETQWNELLKILKETVDKQRDADVDNLNFEEKARLIRSDPVTCARYFEHRFKELMKTWNVGTVGPFKNNKVKYIYYRIEFQHRGSPHLHGAIWLEGSPEYDAEKPETFTAIQDFIDTIITTDSDDPEVQDIIKYQTHNCTHTCWKRSNGKKICRFGAPFKPMPHTIILQPIPEDEPLSDENMEKCRSLIENLNELLNGDLNEIGTFNELLVKLNCTIEEYMLAVRSQLTSDQIFIERAPKNARINNYSKRILTLMRANIDVQFVLNVYGCLGYIVEYINKSSRGISRLLRSCVESFSDGNMSIREKLQVVSNTFYNGTEISAQEAAWCRMRLPMSSSSVLVEFINTGPMKTRHRMIKSPSELKKLPIDSLDIYKKGSIERYSERPAELENLCLADFIALFNFKSKKSINDDELDQNNNAVYDNLIENNDEDITDKKMFELIDGTIHRRKQPKVIRFCRFDSHKDPKNFFRERLMLFRPWRNEVEELENPTWQELEQIYLQNQEYIDAKTAKYIKIDVDLTALISELENIKANEEIEEGTRDNNFIDDDLQRDNIFDYDENNFTTEVLTEMGTNNNRKSSDSATTGEVNRLTIPDQMNTDQFFSLVNSLNEKQHDYLMHILSCFKSAGDELPLYHFISGEAGVGKSRLINSIYQTLIRLFRKVPGPVDNPEIIIVAYTGKAAHNVNGVTSHNAFSLAMVGSDESKISAEALNTLRVKFSKLQLVIIDEISMMGRKTFDKINVRLCQVFQTNQPFGGKSIIVLGDFQQLRPVLDDYVFSAGKDPVKRMVGNPLWKKFQLFELTEIMRQKDDLPYAEALGRLAKGQTTVEDEEMFKSRCFVDNNALVMNYAHQRILPAEARSAVRLMWRNSDVDAYNIRRLNELKPFSMFSYEVEARDSVVGAHSQKEIKQVLHNLQKLPTQKTHGLPKKIILQEGVRYMITSNIDVSDGLFNGATGILRFVETYQQSDASLRVKYGAAYLEFDDPKVGVKARLDRQKHISATPAIKSDWTPVKPMELEFSVTKKLNAQARRIQYPMVVAEAMTIHKSQGSTMSKVVVHLSKGMELSLIYVAFTRSTLLTGLYIIGEFQKPKPLRDDHLPSNEMKRLREFAKLIPKFAFLKDVPSDIIQIISHNVQSIRNNHINTIRNDRIFMNSEFLLLQETWATSNETFRIEGMHEIQRNNIQRQPTARGTMIYSKLNVPAQPFKSYSFNQGNQRIDITSCIANNILLINIYKNPSCIDSFFEDSLISVHEIFSAANLILCGDFNDKHIADEGNRLHRFLASTFQLQLLSSKNAVTTDGCTSIDAVFGKLLYYKAKVYVYESFSSYHKPLVIRIKETSNSS